jgi:hypothetical protein
MLFSLLAPSLALPEMLGSTLVKRLPCLSGGRGPAPRDFAVCAAMSPDRDMLYYAIR